MKIIIQYSVFVVVIVCSIIVVGFGWNQFSVDMNFNGSTQQNIVGVTV